MKKQSLILLTVVFAFVLSTVSLPQSSGYSKSNSSLRVIEDNYLKGLKSDNQGLRISCAYFLGEMKSNRAVIPLMQMLSNEQHEGAKIIAAWSLIKIGDPRGVYRVRREADLSTCCSVQCMCDFFYKQHLSSQNATNEVSKN